MHNRAKTPAVNFALNSNAASNLRQNGVMQFMHNLHKNPTTGLPELRPTW
jgi:hypothetical protein